MRKPVFHTNINYSYLLFDFELHDGVSCVLVTGDFRLRLCQIVLALLLLLDIFSAKWTDNRVSP